MKFMIPIGTVHNRKVISAKASDTMKTFVVVDKAFPDLYRTAKVRRLPKTPNTPIKV